MDLISNLCPSQGESLTYLCLAFSVDKDVTTGAGRNVLDCVRFYSEQVSRFWLIIVVI